MESTVCAACRSPKGAFKCGICKSRLCKKCTQPLEAGSFSFLHPLPEELAHTIYCGPCRVTKVDSALAQYEDTLAKAKAIYVFSKGQEEESRYVGRSEKPLQVSGCADRAEALMRIAFTAADLGFNCLVDVAVTGKSVRNHAYENSVWDAKGIPAHVDGKRVERASRPGKHFISKD